MNLLESLFAAVTVNDQPPMHAGEVMSLWTYSVVLDEGRALCLFLLNHTRDPELKTYIEHFVSAVEDPQRKRLHNFMRNEGLTLPHVTPDKGRADPAVLPPGAQLGDDEIANMMVAKLTALLQALHGGLITCLRNDIGAMLYAFQTEMYKEAFMLKQTMSKRGWLKVPPSFLIAKAE